MSLKFNVELLKSHNTHYLMIQNIIVNYDCLFHKITRTRISFRQQHVTNVIFNYINKVCSNINMKNEGKI